MYERYRSVSYEMCLAAERPGRRARHNARNAGRALAGSTLSRRCATAERRQRGSLPSREIGRRCISIIAFENFKYKTGGPSRGRALRAPPPRRYRRRGRVIAIDNFICSGARRASLNISLLERLISRLTIQRKQFGAAEDVRGAGRGRDGGAIALVLRCPRRY
ncbi:hypothetical protein EVAR_89037_1 [Eumeta japonica]|uniref:Uncharacterized protein n=1 Tax=Eumeta variegata TaxID=151549 RepID=A0A4C1Z4T9_EUMVA|nr:hypothetical protein EVAR_89037_1 [Eumeta japonica]